jgi:hypothetical protein
MWTWRFCLGFARHGVWTALGSSPVHRFGFVEVWHGLLRGQLHLRQLQREAKSAVSGFSLSSTEHGKLQYYPIWAILIVFFTIYAYCSGNDTIPLCSSWDAERMWCRLSFSNLEHLPTLPRPVAQGNLPVATAHTMAFSRLQLKNPDAALPLRCPGSKGILGLCRAVVIATASTCVEPRPEPWCIG